MPARTRNLNVTVGADVKPLKRGMDEAGRSVDKFGRTAEAGTKKFGVSTRAMGTIALGATAAVGGLVATGASFIKAYEESAKVGRQTNAVLKSTGGAAGVTAKQVGDLATAISRKSGMDDEAVQSAENVLLTFTKVRNETGKGNKVFDSATKVIADMSAALGQDLQSSTIQVGKALNDPIKGITALSRVGVSFTKQQKAQITALVDSGKTMDAQKVILRELNREFAGSAAAAATPFDKLKVSLGNLQETIGGALAPKVEDAANKLNRFVEQMQDGTGAGGRFVDKLKEIKDDVAPVVRDFAKAASAVARFTSKHPDIAKVATAVLGIGIALKTLKFASALTGFTDLLKAGRVAGTGLKRILGRAGTDAGASVSTNAAETVASNLGGSLNARKGRIRGALTSVFRSGASAAGATASATAAEAVGDRIGPSMDARKGKFRGAGRAAGSVLGAGLKIGILAFLPEITTAISKAIQDVLPASSRYSGSKGWGNLLNDIKKGASSLNPFSTGQTDSSGGLKKRRAVGGRIPGAIVAADSVPALLSPQEFVVTGDGERTLESMTFPGVLDWLQGVQAPHFATGGRVAQVARQAGFRGSALVRMIAIAHRESRFDENATNFKYPDHSIGLWQINQLAHKGKYGTDSQLKNPLTNAKAAWAISGHGRNFSPWSTNAGLSEADLRLGRRLAITSRGGGSGMSGGTGGGTTTERTVTTLGQQYMTGYQAGLEGGSIKGVLSTALGYVGTAGRAAASVVSGSMRRSSSSASPTTRAGHRAIKAAWNPAGKPVANWIIPYLNWARGHGWSGTVNSGYRSFAEQQRIYNSGVRPAAKPGTSNHEGDAFPRGAVDVTNASQLSSVLARYPGGSRLKWAGSKDPVHFSFPHGGSYRRGGRVRFQGGGYANARALARRYLPRSSPKSTGMVARLLDRIRGGSTGTVRTALKQLQPFLADKGNYGSLLAWINAANRRAEGRGVTSAGRRGLTAFVGLAQAEYGRQLGRDVAGVDAVEGGFDQSMTDLGNELAANRATDAQTAGAQGALATTQLNQLYADRVSLSGSLKRAQRTGNRKLVADLSGRLAANQSAILAKRAEVVGYQDQYTAALQPDDAQQALVDALNAVAEATKAHNDLIAENNAQMKRQTDTAVALNQTDAFTVKKYLADVLSGQIGGYGVVRSYTAGTGALAAY